MNKFNKNIEEKQGFNPTKINYIKHDLEVSRRLMENENISALDVSLYRALFFVWNSTGFKKAISVNRAEMMKRSKIGSKNTYSESIKRLVDNGFISYKRFNSSKGSLIWIIPFDKENDDLSSTESGTAVVPKVVQHSYQKWDSSSTESDTLHKTNIKHNKTEVETTANSFSDNFNSDEIVGNKNEPPFNLDEMKNYCLENGYNEKPAILAFEYYEANDWKDKFGKPVKPSQANLKTRYWFKKEYELTPPVEKKFHEMSWEEQTEFTNRVNETIHSTSVKEYFNDPKSKIPEKDMSEFDKRVFNGMIQKKFANV